MHRKEITAEKKAAAEVQKQIKKAEEEAKLNKKNRSVAPRVPKTWETFCAEKGIDYSPNTPGPDRY